MGLATPEGSRAGVKNVQNTKVILTSEYPNGTDVNESNDTCCPEAEINECLQRLDIRFEGCESHVEINSPGCTRWVSTRY